MAPRMTRVQLAAVVMLVLSGCDLASEPRPDVVPLVGINGVEGKAIRWCSSDVCADMGVESPESLPAAWLPYEADLPPGWRVESGFSRAQRFGSPHVELEVGDRGVANVAGDAAMLCYLVASEAGDVITYCWATSDVIP